MKVLGKMISSRLDALYDECHSLDLICKSIGIETSIPILRLKKKSGEPELPLLKKKQNKLR